jgi:diguanylate cyclase (GGDEF)-like protein
MNAAADALTAATGDLEACLVAARPGASVHPREAAQAARHAMQQAQALGHTRESARAGAWLCGHLLVLGRHAEVLSHARAVLPLLTGPELDAERLETLRVTALAGSEIGHFDVALDAAQEMVRLTASRGEDGPALSAAFVLAACFERMGDSWQAIRLLSQALQNHGQGSADRAVLIATNALCAIGIGMAHKLRDTDADHEVATVLEQARQSGERARALLAQVPDPAYEVVVLGNLGEVLLHQWRQEEAERLLGQACALAAARGLQAYGWRIRATMGHGLWQQGRSDEALSDMEALHAEMGEQAPPQTAIRVRGVMYRACRALGRFEAALGHLEIVERLERSRVTNQLRAQSRVFVTRTEAQEALRLAEQARLDAQLHRARAAEFAASAERDPLTGLGNRRHLERRFTELLPAGQSAERELAVAQIDIDHFKSINDSHGHALGDRVLVQLAQLLRDNSRAGDVLVRHGGEEFVVVLPGMTLSRAAEVCERLRSRVAEHPWGREVPGLAVTISIGLCAAPPGDAALLMLRADEALYRAKRAGRNRLVLGG